jgi:quinol monooxygenase YgiN
MSHQLQVIAHYYTLVDQTERVAQALQSLAEATRHEPDNISYQFFQSRENPQHFVILERYRSESGLDAHRATQHFQEIGIGIIAPLLERKEVESFLVANNHQRGSR